MEPLFPLLNHLFIKKQFQGSLNYSWIWAELTEGFTRGQTPPTCTESSAGASAVNYFKSNKTFGCWARGIKAQATKGYIQLKHGASSSQQPRGYSTQLARSKFRAKALRAQTRASAPLQKPPAISTARPVLRRMPWNSTKLEKYGPAAMETWGQAPRRKTGLKQRHVGMHHGGKDGLLSSPAAFPCGSWFYNANHTGKKPELSHSNMRSRLVGRSTQNQPD